MIRLYVPTFNSDRPDSFFRCVRYEMGSFDLTSFWRGNRFNGTIPNDVRIMMSDGDPPDFTLPPMSWFVFSDRAAARIASRAGDAVQFFDARLYHHKTGDPIAGYKVLNATKRSRCLDLSKAKVRYDSRNPGQIETVLQYAFDESLIPGDLHVFRAAEQPVLMFFSRQLMNDLMTGDVLRDLAFLEKGGDEPVEIRRKTIETQDHTAS